MSLGDEVMGSDRELSPQVILSAESWADSRACPLGIFGADSAKDKKKKVR